MKRLFLITTVLLATMGASVWAGPAEDGEAAFKRGDYTEALRLWRPAASGGLARAQYGLGGMYDLGMAGLPRDHAEAAKWYRLAADQGDADGQFSLGSLYRRGEGVPLDYAQAIRWFRLAAAQGSWNGQTALGELYRDGHGVPSDHILAYMWFNVASASSSELNSVSRDLRDAIAKRMTPQQIAEAQKLARECLQRTFKNCN